MINMHSQRHTLTCIIPAITSTIFSTFISAASTQPSRLRLQTLTDVQVQYLYENDNGRYNSWYNGGPLSMRYGSDENTLQLSQIGLAGRFRSSDNSELHATVIYYGGKSAEATITEAWWHYQPIPSSPWRQSLKIGAFYAPISEENTGPLWSSPYSLNSSTINTWVGEEMRTIGAEWRWDWSGKYTQSAWDTALLGAIYGFNDTAGTMISWRGWGSHDRQSGAGTKIAMSNMPSLQWPFSKQTPYYEPFIETDNRPGYYLGAEAKYQFNHTATGTSRLKFSYLYYDNRADPESLKQGQYGWHTRFHHLGGKWKFSQRWDLLAQYLQGNTGMGPNMRGVKNDFWSGYLMASKRWRKHRMSLRWDRFEVTDKDGNSFDNNKEHGYSAMASYGYNLAQGLKLSATYTYWSSERPERHYITDEYGQSGQALVETTQLLLSLRYYFDSAR